MEAEKIIAFDLTQKEWGRVNENYSIFKDIFEDVGFKSEIYIEFPLRLNSLKECAIFVILCPDSSKLRLEEINALTEYVADGGILMIFSSAGGDQGRRTNLNALLQNFNLAINNDEVMDPDSNFGLNSFVKINVKNDLVPFNNINNFCYRCGCSLTTNNSNDIVLYSNKTSDPSNCPIFIISNYQKGIILLSGSYEAFRDDLKGGIDNEENKILTRNLANYLWKFVINDSGSKVSSQDQDLSFTPKISLFNDEENKYPKDDFLEKRINMKINDLENEISEIHKENDLIKIECKRIYQNLEDQINEYHLNQIEMFKDDLSVNIDEILTSLDLKVNNLTSKLLKLEKKISDYSNEFKMSNKRMEGIEKLIGSLAFKYDELIKRTKRNETNLNEDISSPIITKAKLNLDPSFEISLEKKENINVDPEQKLKEFYRLRANIIKKYKSGELERNKFQNSLNTIKNKINYYKSMLV
ncbi:MAG: hypothetical protein ACTSX4_02520 [Candidatus Helarchaeota archaeon]